MFTRPPDVPDSAVEEAVALAWGLHADQIEYAPVGFGSHHWRVSANGQRWFVTIDDLDARQRDASSTRDDAATRLTAALDTARALYADGLAFVVAPNPTLVGDTTHRLRERYVTALYEHINGTTHDFGSYTSRTNRLEVLDRLVALHQATDCVRKVALVDDFAIPSRDHLEVTLADHRLDWGPGPFAARAKDLLRQHATALASALAHYDGLVADVIQSPERFVITHGEPHRANTIGTADGVVLIDWDTTLIAPPERDLWMLINDEPGIAEDYTERTGVAVDAVALELYQLWWDLSEVALYVAEFRAPHTDTEDARTAWAGLCEYLDPTRWNLES